MANDPFYDAVLSRAGVHLLKAWRAFESDPAIPWGQVQGDVPKARVRAWLDAVRAEVMRQEQIERRLS
jgi:hypothetical protein